MKPIKKEKLEYTPCAAINGEDYWSHSVGLPGYAVYDLYWLFVVELSWLVGNFVDLFGFLNQFYIIKCVSYRADFADAHTWSYDSCWQDAITNASKSLICYIHELFDYMYNLWIWWFPDIWRYARVILLKQVLQYIACKALTLMRKFSQCLDFGWPKVYMFRIIVDYGLDVWWSNTIRQKY